MFVGPIALRVGVTGKFTLLEPWISDPEVNYQCIRIGTISDHKIVLGIDVLNDIYIENGLTEEEYQSALRENINIVTLSSLEYDPILVPHNYITKYPDVNYIAYPRSVITVDLGLLPFNILIDDLLEEINNLVEYTINVKSETKFHQSDSGKFVSYDAHLDLETVRNSKISDRVTAWQRIRNLEIENDALSAAIRDLEDQLT